MKDEVWVPVVGYETMYEVSDQGRVRTIPRTVEVPNRWGGVHQRKFERTIKALYPHPQTGHLQVDLGSRTRGTVKRKKVHHLVLEAFVGPRPAGTIGCHWDDNPVNNTVENLRWATHSENSYDAIRNGVHPTANKTHCHKGHEYTPENTRRYANGTRRCYTCQQEHYAKKKAGAKNA